MGLTSGRERLVGRSAWVMAWMALVVGQLHALARHATTQGKDDLDLPLTRAWSVPVSRVLRPLLDWSNPDTVYLTYGKLWLPVFVTFTVCAFVVRRHRSARGALERWAWRIALIGYVVATAGVFGAYYTPWLDQSFLFLVLPGLALSVIGSTVLGIALLRAGFHPKATAWLLALWIPLFLAIAQVTSLGNTVLPAIFAFAVVGRRIATGRWPERESADEHGHHVGARRHSLL